MRYVGGKGRIAKGVADAILDNSTLRDYYLEPFLGGAAVFPHVAPNFRWAVAGDLHPYLILMWNALIFDGWQPPRTYSEAEYLRLKTQEASPDRALAGFGGSFGGKWFGGYARGGKKADGAPRDHQNESVRSIEATRDKIHRLMTPERLGRFRNWNYDQWRPAAGTVIYCDPPYAATLGYSTGDFDTESFWRKCREWASSGCEVFVSEYEAPEFADEVWSGNIRQSVARPEQGRGVKLERLFKVAA